MPQEAEGIVKALEVYPREVQKAYGLTGPQLWALKVLVEVMEAGDLEARFVFSDD